MINVEMIQQLKGKTSFNAVFVRNIAKIQIEHFISYFSYHNLIVNIIDVNIPSPEN